MSTFLTDFTLVNYWKNKDFAGTSHNFTQALSPSLLSE